MGLWLVAGWAAAAQTDIATAGAAAFQPLLILVAVILVIVGAKKILKPKATAQATADPQSA